MRTLLFTRGAPGVGKTFLLEKAGLSKYTLSSDAIRLMLSAPKTNVNGTFGISQKENSKTWSILFKMLETRMENGDFTVVDATCATRSEMNRYKQLAQKYRYKLFCIDMTSVPIEIAKEQNKKREEFRRVPDYVIDKMYDTFKSETIPSGINVIGPEELLKENLGVIGFNPIDLSGYKKVHHIGDVHGCMEPLNSFFSNGIKEDEAYIFTGDYLDRGIQNIKVLKFMMDIADRKNVFLLEGNHEKHLWKWANGEIASSDEFEQKTKVQLEAADISKKEVRKFVRKLLQCAYYTYNEKTISVTHGGMSVLPSVFVSTKDMISGTGNYQDAVSVDNAFYDRYNPAENKAFIYQIHGHRNVTREPIQINNTCFNLENEVEFGGNLRIVSISNDTITTTEIQNNTFAEIDYGKINKELPIGNIEEVIKALRSTRFINEKKFGNISSFNFSREAFAMGRWTKTTVKARGLFINTKTNKIVARGYEKFFNAEERRETSIESLKNTLAFPVTAYVKENGFLGILGYDEENDELFLTSKSTPNGNHANYFKDIFYNTLNENEIANLKKYLKENNYSLVFEVIDVDNDHHIIEYNGSHLVLLDAIKRDISFETMDYNSLVSLGKKFGFKVKERACVFNSWDEFIQWYSKVKSEDYLYNGRYVEGFVLQDANGFMFKKKTGYYTLWKWLRTVAGSVISCGYYRKANVMTEGVAMDFYKWIKQHYTEYDTKVSIIVLRKQFLDEYTE